MLPGIDNPLPAHDEIDIYASMIPDKEVGGDFYDMFLIDDNHLVICIKRYQVKEFLLHYLWWYLKY